MPDLTPEVRRAIEARAVAGYPDEVCGVLVGRDGVVTGAVAVENRAADPRRGFEIAPEDLLRVQDEAGEIVGYFHSHPDHPAVPSETDRRRAAEGLSDGVVHVIVAVTREGVTAVRTWVFREARAEFEPLA